MIKLAVNHQNYAAAVNLGTALEEITYIVEIENEQLEYLLKPRKYTVITISVVQEETDGK